MIAASLSTERKELEGGETALPYDWRGETVLVRDCARNGVEIAKLFLDRGIGADEKAERIVRLMFADPADAFCAADCSAARFGELVSDVAWDVFGVNAGGHSDEEPMWDLEEDAAVIRASLRQAYGLDWDEVRGSISWHEFLVLVGSLPYETPLGRAMYYRNPKNRPERTKYNREQVVEFDRLHRAYALGGNRSKDPVESSQKAMDDMALAFKTKARRR